ALTSVREQTTLLSPRTIYYNTRKKCRRPTAQVWVCGWLEVDCSTTIGWRSIAPHPKRGAKADPDTRTKGFHSHVDEDCTCFRSHQPPLCGATASTRVRWKFLGSIAPQLVERVTRP
ncbi:unnamed protein product, partial [Ectocarpus sp. 8 AP-2014]